MPPATWPLRPASRRFPAAIRPAYSASCPSFSSGPARAKRASGSITGVFSVLVDGDDHNDPVADNIRGTLDGHIVLERAIADQGRFPAVNVLTSISRLAKSACTPEQWKLVTKLRAMIARFEDTRDLRLIGGYRSGSDADLDRAMQLVPKIYEAMRQSPDDPASTDVFQEIARALSEERQGMRSAGAAAHSRSTCHVPGTRGLSAATCFLANAVLGDVAELLDKGVFDDARAEALVGTFHDALRKAAQVLLLHVRKSRASSL